MRYVQCQCRLAHAGTRREDYQVRFFQPAQRQRQLVKPCRPNISGYPNGRASALYLKEVMPASATSPQRSINLRRRVYQAMLRAVKVLRRHKPSLSVCLDVANGTELRFVKYLNLGFHKFSSASLTSPPSPFIFPSSLLECRRRLRSPFLFYCLNSP